MIQHLQKGQKINLTKGKNGLHHLLISLGWKSNDLDIDSAAFLLQSNGKVTGDGDFVFYGNLRHYSGAVEHKGNEGNRVFSSDIEHISLDLNKIPSTIDKIVFTLTIYDTNDSHKNFRQVKDAYICVSDEDTGSELVRYDLSEHFSVETAIVAGVIYRYNGEWKFNAVGSGFSGGLKALCENYGVDVKDEQNDTSTSTVTELSEHKNSGDDEFIEENKVIALFQFIRDMNRLKQKAILNYKVHPWYLELSSIHSDPKNIHIYYRDRVEEDTIDTELYDENILLSVHKPEFQKCPEPDSIFMDWLISGWDNFRQPVSVKEAIAYEKNEIESVFKPLQTDENISDNAPVIIRFEDSEERVKAYNAWLILRSNWVERQKIIENTQNLFARLYHLYFELQRESETEEIIVANGIICDRDNPDIHHPVLTHRVKVNYDANQNTVFVLDTDASTELYSIAFQVMEGVNLDSVKEISEDLQKNDYHPLDRNDTPNFLKILIHQLSSDSLFSESGIPKNWSDNNRILLYMGPCYILRKRLDGTSKAIEQIIENIQENGDIPAPIRDIVSGGKVQIPESTDEESIEEQLASVGGESIDILLSKEANREQLEIARRIENYNAVLVQGPPGTGKTHTIANLMGHFLAQGKSVLVTSHTKKALSVLKEKLVPELQSLCVSMLDDSNTDMERSVDGITSYMSDTNSYELKREIDRISVERQDIIRKLAEVRRKIFAIIYQECNCIVYNGKDMSPSEAAKFVLEHSEDLSYIPGNVRLNAPMPLTYTQLSNLYRSNEYVSAEDETELSHDLPSPDLIMPPAEFSSIWAIQQETVHQIENIASQNHWVIDNDEHNHHISIKGSFGVVSIQYPSMDAIDELKDFIRSFGKIEQWMKIVAIDGRKGGAFRQRWLTLIDQIQKTNDYVESIMPEQYGIDINFSDIADIGRYRSEFEKIRTIFGDKGKLGWLDKFLHKEYDIALESVTINGKRAQTTKDCDIILHCIELAEIRKQCSVYWNQLLTGNELPEFNHLDANYPEQIARKWIPLFQKYLDWYQDVYQVLLDKLAAVGISSDVIFEINPQDSDLVATDKILYAITNIVPAICDILIAGVKKNHCVVTINKTKAILIQNKRRDSRVCGAIFSAINQGDINKYAETYSELERMYEKYALQRNRVEMLKAVGEVAPQWAEAIRVRNGIHGQNSVPSDIEDAWKWKQLCGIVKEIVETPFDSLQADALRLSKEYRSITAQYAEKCSWCHLLERTETDKDMQQTLQGWKQTIQKIGKGTGKKAPLLKARARELMSKCQKAVPGWIMPMSRALESLNPKVNRFDVVIIDEASQSDVSSLAILYMGKKLIIVGDDKQVSPMAVGVNEDEICNLQEMYIKDKIPNAHLYDAKTSIYDIAATTFQPLMLREHFRCVPEIIGFSNMLSYDNKIKPLRDASSSNLLPAVVNYRVNGRRDGKNKTNMEEAKAIVSIMKACMEQPEYDGKSFGVISLLGNEGDQVKLISQLIEQEIDHKEVTNRNILCGNSANFQGDERDVIFLSMVDSGAQNLMGFGTNDAYRKRYNVAASRAKDQLWVIDSLDTANDLKAGDIRKILIDYSINPHAIEVARAKAQKKAESPFEVAVASALLSRGYHIEQQWNVGAYRLDMVAVCGKKMVAIECDGERYHSGEAKVREDMERQTILERIGWRFIRIRGSEYYRDSEQTMKRVVAELSAYGIEPEEICVATTEDRGTELLSRVKDRAAIIMYSGRDSSDNNHDDTIMSALNPMDMVPDNPPNVIADNASSAMILKNFSATQYRGTASESQNSGKSMEGMLKKSHSNMPETEDSFQLSHSQQAESVAKPTQILMPGLGSESDAMDVISLLKKYNVTYQDKRSSQGALWIIGGSELKPVVAEARKLGVDFKFKKGGGKATRGKDAWWAK